MILRHDLFKAGVPGGGQQPVRPFRDFRIGLDDTVDEKMTGIVALLRRIEESWPDQFSVEFLREGPEVWQVAITRRAAEAV